MRLTRRTFIAGSLGAAAISSLPAAVRASTPGLLIADPALLAEPPARGTLAASGKRLLASLMPQIRRWDRIEAVLDEGDTVMLAQLVRFQPGLRWRTERVMAGTATSAGIVRRPAILSVATKGDALDD